jgi:heme/copper-type cytochrome/quinol oxidase subunit 2
MCYFLSAVWIIILTIAGFFIFRWLFYKKDSRGKYDEQFKGTFFWEYGKWYVKAVIAITIGVVVLFAFGGVFQLW